MSIEIKLREYIEKQSDAYQSIMDEVSGGQAPYYKESYIAGAELMIPLLMKAIEQRNWYISNKSIREYENSKLLEMIGASEDDTTTN